MGKSKKKHPKKRTVAFKETEPNELVKAPHFFIIHRGLTCPYITDLISHSTSEFLTVDINDSKERNAQ